MARDTIATCLRPIREDDTPNWLWRHEPDQVALALLPENGRFRSETGATEVIDRLAGAWTYQGWKGGYFDSEQDARIFFDECRWLLFHRKGSPDIAQWRSTGLYWAYGIPTDANDSYITDYRSGTVRRAEAGDIPPHGMFINGVHDSSTGEGGGWDLWRRESLIISADGHCGANVSKSGAGHLAGATAAFIGIGEAAATAARNESNGPLSTRRITIDGTHPDSQEIANRRAASLAAAEIFDTGRSLTLRHMQAILDACRKMEGRKGTDPTRNTALRLAIQSARQAMVPDAAINRALEMVRQNRPVVSNDVLSASLRSSSPDRQADCNTATVVRVSDSYVRDALTSAENENATLVDSVAVAAWTAGNTGLEFSTTTEKWNTGASDGLIRSAAGDGSFVFLDDTAAECATLNSAAFLRDDASFDIEGFRHATALMTLVLDISLMTTALPSPRLARRVWDFRPLSLSLCGIGPLLMASGLSYDSDEGRALCAGLCALLTGTAYRTSSEIAGELGPCPASADNATALQQVLENHRDALCSHERSLPASLADAASSLWDEVIDRSETGSFRNAYLSAICSMPNETMLLDCAASGIATLPSLVRFERTAGGAYRKTIDPAVPAGLRALGYTQAQTDAIVSHVIGHGTLAQAPGVNHETLRKRGFTDAAIATVEATLPDIDDISLVFNRWVLGDVFCRQMLGFTQEDLADDAFDMLAALGFSDAGIEAANVYCCGAFAIDNVPYLSPDHLAVFDCAAPQGVRGHRQVSPDAVVRMMAAAQPLVSGGIGHALVMPETATADDCHEIFLLAWRLGLKSLVMGRREGEPDDRAYHGDWPEEKKDRSALFLISDRGHRLEMTSNDNSAVASLLPQTAEITPVEFAPEKLSDAPAPSATGLTEPARAHPIPTGTNIAIDGNNVDSDAETSRCASSHAARGAASVPSSAGAVVEQRQV